MIMMKIFICLALFFVTANTSVAHGDNETRKGVIVYSVSPGYLLKGVGSYFVDTGDRMIRGMGKVITAPFKAKAHFPKPKRYLYQPPILIPGKFIPLPPLKKIKETEKPELPQANYLRLKKPRLRRVGYDSSLWGVGTSSTMVGVKS